MDGSAAQSQKTEAAFWTFLTATLQRPALRLINSPVSGSFVDNMCGPASLELSADGAAPRLDFLGGFQHAYAGGAARYMAHQSYLCPSQMAPCACAWTIEL